MERCKSQWTSIRIDSCNKQLTYLLTYYYQRFYDHLQRGIALSRVLRTALVPYGNMETSTPHSSETSQVITMKLCMFDYVRETNTCAKFGWNPPTRGRSTHTWNIHFLWLFFLPAFLPYMPFTCDFFHYLTTINLETFQRIYVTKVTRTDNFTF